MAKLGRRGSNPGGILPTQEVAIILGISPPTLLKMLKERRIPEPQRVGQVRRWNHADLVHARVVLDELRERGLVRTKGASK
jgi:excisionase family DNA binding protein